MQEASQRGAVTLPGTFLRLCLQGAVSRGDYSFPLGLANH